jgi:hypothetical protein
MGLLEGSDSLTSKTLAAEDENKKKITIPNPAYDTCIMRDQQVVSYLVNSLSEVLLQVFGLTHAADVWTALHEIYSSQSKSRVSTIRGALTNTKKLDMTAQQYITKMKGFASELAAAGKPVDDDELKDYILNGLDCSYNGLVVAINAHTNTKLNDACSRLLPMRLVTTWLPPMARVRELFCPQSMLLPGVRHHYHICHLGLLHKLLLYATLATIPLSSVSPILVGSPLSTTHTLYASSHVPAAICSTTLYAPLCAATASSTPSSLAAPSAGPASASGAASSS